MLLLGTVLRRHRPTSLHDSRSSGGRSFVWWVGGCVDREVWQVWGRMSCGCGVGYFYFVLSILYTHGTVVV